MRRNQKPLQTVQLHSLAGFPGLMFKEGIGAHAERLHAHCGHSIGFVRSGRTRVRTGTERFELGGGQFISIPAGVPHLCDPEDPAAFEYAVLYFPSSLTEARLEGDGALSRKVCAGCLDAIPTRADFERESDIRRLLAACLEGVNSVCGPYRSILDPDDGLVDREFPSRFQAYREFRALYGTGTQNVRLNARIEKAKSLLLKDEPLVDIALNSGFYDQSHFIRAFRLFTGMLPSEYRDSVNR